jgi:hypothetical protein
LTALILTKYVLAVVCDRGYVGAKVVLGANIILPKKALKRDNRYQQDSHVAPNPKTNIKLDAPGKQGRYVIEYGYVLDSVAGFPSARL